MLDASRESVRSFYSTAILLFVDRDERPASRKEKTLSRLFLIQAEEYTSHDGYRRAQGDRVERPNAHVYPTRAISPLGSTIRERSLRECIVDNNGYNDETTTTTTKVLTRATCARTRQAGQVHRRTR